MKKFIALIFFLLLLALMMVTCPNEEAHSKLVKERFSEAVKLEMKDKAGKTFGSLGSALAKPFVKTAINKALSVDNYGVVSIGRLKVGESERVISIGLLNHVFTASSQRLQSEIEKALSKKPADDETTDETTEND